MRDCTRWLQLNQFSCSFDSFVYPASGSHNSSESLETFLHPVQSLVMFWIPFVMRDPASPTNVHWANMVVTSLWTNQKRWYVCIPTFVCTQLKLQWIRQKMTTNETPSITGHL